MKKTLFFLSVACIASLVHSQSKDAYDQNGPTPAAESDSGSTVTKGLFDRSRLTISNSMNFGMSSMSGMSGSQSSSFYSTHLQYKFVAPVTVNLNFALPIHSTYSPYQNFSQSNMQSLDYFKNMPFDMTVSWQPSKNMHLSFSVISAPQSMFGYHDYDPLYSRSPFGMYRRW